MLQLIICVFVVCVDVLFGLFRSESYFSVVGPGNQSKFRVLGALSQYAPFQQAFSCPVGTPMAPQERCALW